MTTGRQLSAEELEQGLGNILKSPKDEGALELIVKRPDVDQRESVTEGRLDVSEGLVGDNWRDRGNRHMPDGAADPDRQITIMNARVVALVAGDPDRHEVAGDQLYLDMDLSSENLPSGCWRISHRSYGVTTHRMQEVCRSLRSRCDGVCKRRDGEDTEPAWH